MKGAVAAGHRLTAEAGARVLQEGGNAVDACVAASFAAWVTESPLTGPGAGGFALVWPADGRPPRVADFFVLTPGLGRPVEPGAQMHAIDVGFGGDSETTQVFRIGEASCAVPGTARGLESVHASYGRLPWPELLQPAIELARGGVEVSREQAHLHAILDLILRHAGEGRRLYSRPDGMRLVPGDTLRLPDLGETLERVAAGGASVLYRGELADALVATVGGTITKQDLASYRVSWRRPVRVRFREHEVVSNPPPSSGGILIAYSLDLLERVGRPGDLRALVEVMDQTNRARTEDFVQGLHSEGYLERFMAVEALESVALDVGSRLGSTTHLCVLDGDGGCATVTCSNGSCSGVIVPGTGVHLNNMLGEEDLNPLGFHRHEPGRRIPSMMAPTVVLRDGKPEVALGSAGSNRIRSAILQTILAVIDGGLGAQDAVEAPRVHFEGGVLEAEPGVDEGALDALEREGWQVQRWRERNLYFGGAQAVARAADTGELSGGGDPRRGGVAVLVE